MFKYLLFFKNSNIPVIGPEAFFFFFLAKLSLLKQERENKMVTRENSRG